LLVRLCEATSAEALQAARQPGVEIRFFTAQEFHAKVYIVGGSAMVGSANLTDAGLRRNRELAVVIEADDDSFDEIPTYFDELWNSASVLTPDALRKFAVWQARNPVRDPGGIDGIDPATPHTVHAGTRATNAARTYLETFRAFYVESLMPAHRIVTEVYAEGPRHPAFEGQALDYEIDRFLYWARGFATDEELQSFPIRASESLKDNIRSHLSQWFAVTSPKALHIDHARAQRRLELKRLFSDQQLLSGISMDEIVDALQGCAAFVELQRFTEGGLEKHIQAFRDGNSIERVRQTFEHLAFGPGDYVQRIYDCVYGRNFKLVHFGRNCTLELYGWINSEQVPPFNGRTMKALRYLGFDVRG
jgi:hypothetical protein